MDDQPELLDLNTASLDELTTIPGIGPAMAKRIIAARPFATPEDLHRVNGIDASVLERLKLFATVASTPEEPEEAVAAEPEPVEAVALEPGPVEPDGLPGAVVALPAPESDASAVEAEPAPQPATAPADVPTTTPVVEPSPTYATRFQALWIALASSVITLLLALLFVLGLLTLLNGGLRYASPAQVANLGQEIQGVTAELNILKQDMDAVRTRVDNLEGLSGRVNVVEKATATLRRDMDSNTKRIDQLDQRANELATQLEEMQTRTTRFEGFLNSLREMLNGLFKP